MSEKEKSVDTKITETKVDKKQKDKPKVKKQSKTKKWFKELKAEIKKIVWPTKKHVIHNTGVVLTTVIFAVILVSSLDFAFKFVYEALIKLG